MIRRRVVQWWQFVCSDYILYMYTKLETFKWWLHLAKDLKTRFIPLHRKHFLFCKYGQCVWHFSVSLEEPRSSKDSAIPKSQHIPHWLSDGSQGCSVCGLRRLLLRPRQWSIKSHKKAQYDLGQRCPIKLKRTSGSRGGAHPAPPP